MYKWMTVLTIGPKCELYLGGHATTILVLGEQVKLYFIWVINSHLSPLKNELLSFGVSWLASAKILIEPRSPVSILSSIDWKNSTDAL